MTDPCFARGYRRTAEYWRKAAAKLKAEATPRSMPLAEKMAAKWEERAYQFDMDADDIENASRIGEPDEN
jgi:DNA-directed RNA polymerase specialized sigma subunit